MSSESNFSITAKGPESSLHTVRGDTIEEYIKNLKAHVENGAHVAEQAFVESVTGRPAAPTAASVAAAFGGTIIEEKPTFAPVPPPAAAPAAGERTCKHGVMTYRTGNGAKGPWRGYFCPTPKGTPDQCQPQFVR